MRICIDSCIFIQGLSLLDPASSRVLELIGPDVPLVIPRLIAQEITRNLRTTAQVRRFYRLFHERPFAFIVDEPVPRNLVEVYAQKGLSQKADAYIAAFADWMQARYLISDNRHFLRHLTTTSFQVVDASGFLSLWEAGVA